MKKSILLSCIILILVSIGVSGHEVLRLTIHDAILLGLENNLDIYLARLDYENARKEMERQEMIGEKESIEEAEEALKRSREHLDTVKSNLKLQIEQSYFHILKAKERLLSQEEVVSDTERLYRLDEARFQAGYIAELTLIQSKNNLLMTRASYEDQVQSFITQLYRFNELLGIPLEQEIEFIDRIDVSFSPIKITLEEAMELAFLHGESLKEARTALEEAETNVRASDNEYTPPVELERAKTQELKSRVALTRAENRLFFDVRSVYSTLKQRERTVYQRERELAYAKIYHQSMEARFKAEVVSEESLNTAKKEVLAARHDLTNAILDYISAKRDLSLLTGVSQEEWEAREYEEEMDDQT